MHAFVHVDQSSQSTPFVRHFSSGDADVEGTTIVCPNKIIIEILDARLAKRHCKTGRTRVVCVCGREDAFRQFGEFCVGARGSNLFYLLYSFKKIDTFLIFRRAPRTRIWPINFWKFFRSTATIFLRESTWTVCSDSNWTWNLVWINSTKCFLCAMRFWM